jgi:hypothetical protein
MNSGFVEFRDSLRKMIASFSVQAVWESFEAGKFPASLLHNESAPENARISVICQD